MNLAELMEQTARSLAAARDAFGPAPQDPAWTTGGDLSAGRDAVAGAGQQASEWGGETANNYAANNQGQQTALTGVQETDAKTGPLGTAVGQAAASGRDEINATIRDAQTGVAALSPANTPDQQTALAEHLRHQLKRAKAILRAYQAKGAQLASQMRQTGMDYGGIGQGMGGTGGMMPPQGMSGPGGSGLGTLPRGHHHSGIRSVTAHHSTSTAPDARSLGASRPAQAAVQAALTRLGAPYVWGAKGPNQFDCSGLTHWAYAQAGITIGGDTYTQINDGAPVAPSDVQAGDLIFPHSGHVMLAINGHEVVEAQDFGVPVKVSPMPTSFVARRPWPGIPV